MGGAGFNVRGLPGKAAPSAFCSRAFVSLKPTSCSGRHMCVCKPLAARALAGLPRSAPASSHEFSTHQQRQPSAGAETKLASVAPLGAAQLAVGDVAEGLETPVQLLYLLTLLGFLGVAAYLVVRQVLIKRELEEAAKVLGERIRAQEATYEDFFELGVILLRKKLFTQATKNLEKAKKTWGGDESELAQVHNALGFAYFNMERNDLALKEYRKAVELQPGYVTAWNNLGDACEKDKMWRDALKAYEEVLQLAPDNKIAAQRASSLRTRVARLGV